MAAVPSLDDRISIVEGTLVFENYKDLEAKVAELSILNQEQVLAWEAKLGFTSRFTQFNRVIEAEKIHKDSYYAPYTDSLSEDEIILLNLPRPGHSPTYQEAIRRQAIVVYEDSDTANTYTINAVLSKALILDEDGFVRVGDTLKQYLRSEIKYTVNPLVGKSELVKAQITDVEKKVFVGKLFSANRQSYSWGTARYWQRWLHIDNNKKRVAYEIIGTSTDYGISNPTSIDVVNDVGLYSEYKSWGQWTTGNNYRPYWTLNGTWTTRYGLASAHGCAITTSIETNWPGNNAHNSSLLPPVLNYRFRDPANYIFWIEWLYPRGYFTVSSPNHWCEPYRITYIDFNVGVDGDGGGNHILGRHLYTE